MPEIIILYEELPIDKYQYEEYVVRKMIAAGFDMNKPFDQFQSKNVDGMVIQQEPL